MRFILSLFKRLSSQRPRNDNMRAGDFQQPIVGYAVMCKVH
jgi:hypothetical protein